MPLVRRDAILTSSALLFLLAYTLPILWLAAPDLVRTACSALTIATWFVFACDYLIRLRRAPRKLLFVRSNLLDLVVLAVPFARSLRLIRLVSLLHLVSRSAATTFRGQVVRYVVGSTTLILFVSAVAILDAERGTPEATITGFPDALWWSITTVTTVGYGDLSPVTGQGRLIAACLMLAGIALLGVVTASLASWLLERVKEAESNSVEITSAQIEYLRTEISELKQLLAERTAPLPEKDRGAVAEADPDQSS